MSAPVFLLSDFGLRDAYVGVMRAVIAGLAPASPVHDLVHELPPQDLAGARLQLSAALPYLPDGAVLCAVVDPGVGSARRAVAVRARAATGRGLLAVAPDNGLLSPLLATDDWTVPEAVDLPRRGLGPDGPGTTFDGRDVFAPAAARLAAGVEPARLGAPVSPASLVVARDPAPRREPGAWRGEVAWVDRFGNLVTTLTREHLPAASNALRVHVAGRRVEGLSAAFADAPPGEAVAYLGSLGRLELGLAGGDAAAAWGVRSGAEVRVEAGPEADG